MSELRNIIVTAVSEMLDEPGDNGIYKTGRLYDRLESEIEQYYASLPGAQQIHQLIMESVKNSYFLQPEMQRVIAKYLDYQSHPVMTTTEIKSKLFGKDLPDA